jgi:hypothetical protein
MDSSTLQMHRWAAWRVFTTVENIDSVRIDTNVRDLGGCETCGPEYETTQEVYIHCADGSFHYVEFNDAFAMIREMTKDYTS